MRLAADANVLLSCAIQGRSLAVLQHPDIEEVVTPMVVFAEGAEHLGALAKKRGLTVELAMAAFVSLPVRVVPPEEYRHRLDEASSRIGRRDPDDADLLALALAYSIPIWSNDSDFEVAGVDWYTTAELLRHLGIRSR